MPFILLAFLLVTLLLSCFVFFIHAYIFQRWAVLAVLFVAFALISWIKRHHVWKLMLFVRHHSAVSPLALTTLLVSASLFISPMPGLAFLELSWWLALAGLALLVGISSSRIDMLVWQFFGGAAALVLLVYALIALDSINFHWPIFTKPDATPGFANIRQFSDIAVGLMPLALIYVVARRKLSFAVALLTALPLGIWWYLLFLTEGRSAVLSLIIAILVAGVLFRRHAVWPVATLFLSALPALAAWWWLNPLRQAAPSDGGGVFTRDIAVTHDRFMLWGKAWQYALEHFPLGVGPMGFAGDGIDDGYWAYAHAHNLFLNTAAEWGIPLALLLLALVLFGCWKIVRRVWSMPEADRPLYACLVMAFIGVMVNVQFSGAQIVPLSSLVMVLAIGLVFGFRGLSASLPPSTLPAQGAGPGPALLWAAGMLVMAYLLLAGWELYWVSVESTRTCFEELGYVRYYPRFWAQGRLECMQMVAPDHWLFWQWR